MYQKNFIVNADSSLENSTTKECFKLVIFLFLKNKNTKTFLREATLVKIATIFKETKKKKKTYVEQRPLGKTTEG